MLKDVPGDVIFWCVRVSEWHKDFLNVGRRMKQLEMSRLTFNYEKWKKSSGRIVQKNGSLSILIITDMVSSKKKKDNISWWIKHEKSICKIHRVRLAHKCHQKWCNMNFAVWFVNSVSIHALEDSQSPKIDKSRKSESKLKAIYQETPLRSPNKAPILNDIPLKPFLVNNHISVHNHP